MKRFYLEPHSLLSRKKNKKSLGRSPYSISLCLQTRMAWKQFESKRRKLKSLEVSTSLVANLRDTERHTQSTLRTRNMMSSVVSFPLRDATSCALWTCMTTNDRDEIKLTTLQKHSCYYGKRPGKSTDASHCHR